MLIRTYTPEDKAQVIDLMRRNTPAYFDPSEEAGFVNYLEHETEDYFVVEVDDALVGAGGINYDDAQTAVISWDMIHPQWQGKGIGKSLILYRLDFINRKPGITSVRVRTTQLTNVFYAKMGFELERIEKDFWAKGLDLYQMSMSV